MSLRINNSIYHKLTVGRLKKKSFQILKDTSLAIALLFAIIKSPSLWIGLDKVSKKLHLTAVPVANTDLNYALKKEVPDEIKTFLWSKRGLNQKNIIQQKGNCQIMSNIIASTFKEENLKKLESMIEVTDYNLDTRNFYINFAVNINGKRIPVPYNDLINQNLTYNESVPQGPHVLACAIERELKENYLPNPTNYTSASTATFITNKDYSLLLLPVMSDDSLIEVLKQAPNEIVLVGSYAELNNFERIVVNIVNFETNLIEQPSKNGVILQHSYAVKGYKNKNGKHLVTITTYGANGNDEITLTLDELRKNMRDITAPTKTFNYIDSRSAWTYLVLLALIVASRKVINGLEAK